MPQFQGTARSLQALIEALDARTILHMVASEHRAGRISDADAVMLINYNLLDGILFSSLDVTKIPQTRILLQHGHGTPGAATGKVALSIEEAKKYITSGEEFILVVSETRPEHMHYMDHAAGIITHTGGMTSHAAIIARQKGIPAVIGTGELPLTSGETISIDGSAGVILNGAATITPPEPDNVDLKYILDIADRLQPKHTHKIKVKANADTPAAAAKARLLGAQGIGVVRTEHMFFAQDRLPHMQALILASTDTERQQALQALEPMQQQDFEGILREMAGLPVTIRLLDAPMHEFMPNDADDVGALADQLGVSSTKIENRIEALHESNPMLGNRAVRMGILYPEIYEMQTRAILNATATLQQQGIDARPQIMVPLVSELAEVQHIKKMVKNIAAEIEEATGILPTYAFGMMAETPAACLSAKHMAQEVDFFSYGTNDLTQTTLGLSRDDTGDVITTYLQLGILKTHPFQTIHQHVGGLIGYSTKTGKKVNPLLETSVCGEHGGDPASIHMCQQLGVDAVSVSPPRIPVARLVAAQAMVVQDIALEVAQAPTTHDNNIAALPNSQPQNLQID